MAPVTRCERSSSTRWRLLLDANEVHALYMGIHPQLLNYHWLLAKSYPLDDARMLILIEVIQGCVSRIDTL